MYLVSSTPQMVSGTEVEKPWNHDQKGQGSGREVQYLTHQARKSSKKRAIFFWNSTVGSISKTDHHLPTDSKLRWALNRAQCGYSIEGHSDSTTSHPRGS